MIILENHAVHTRLPDAGCEGVPGVTVGTGADRVVVHHVTLGSDTADTRAGAHTLNTGGL